MRFDGIRIHNMGPFRDVDIDLTAIPGKLIAVTGANGAGKSTLLEFLGAGVYRDSSTRGSLVDMATARDSMIEVRVANGKPYTIRQSVDVISKKGEALIMHEGQHVVSSAKVRDADAFVAKHFPSEAVLYNSSFLPQGSEGFVKLSKSERKHVVLKLLGNDKLEAMAEQARDRARDAKAAHKLALTRLEDARTTYPDLALALAANEQAGAELAQAEQAAVAARAALQQAQASVELTKQARERATLRATLTKRIEDADLQIIDTAERIRNNKTLLGRAQEIEAAVQRLERLVQQDTKAAAEFAAAEVTLATCEAEDSAAANRAARALAVQGNAQLRLRQCQERIKHGAAIERAAADLPRLAAAQAECERRIEDIEAQIAVCHEFALDNKDTRIGQLRDGLETIKDGAKKPANIAEVHLLSDDALLEQAQTAPARLESLHAKLANAKAEHFKARNAYADCSVQAGRAGDLALAREQLTTAKKEAEQAVADHKSAVRAHAAADEILQLARTTRDTAAHKRTELAAATQREQATARHAPQLAQARTRLEELEPQLARTQQAREQDLATLADNPAIEAPVTNLPACQTALKTAEAALKTAHQVAASAAQTLERAQAGGDVIAQRESDVAACVETLEDWTRLGQDLGKDGLQALEIDAAIPQLNALTNDLLHTCHGPRFTIEVRTDRLSSDGRKSLEDLDVRVLDTVKGREASIETYSGGERVVLGEALALALTSLACQYAGLRRPTLVRDETGASLDPENGRAYVKMLRRGAELLGAEKVLFVTHSPELQALADARIVVAGGAATVHA